MISLRHRKEIILLIVLTALSGGRGAFSPHLFGDEWGRLYQLLTDGLQCPSTFNLAKRPLLECYPLLLYKLLGLNIAAYHFIGLVLHLLAGVLLYAVLTRMLPRWNWLNLSIAALFLVYPTTLSHTFFERGTYQLSLILLLMGFLGLLVWSEGRSWWFFVLALALVFASLVLYEAYIGITVLFSVLLSLRLRHESIPRCIACLTPALLALAFSLFRWRVQLAAGSIFGHSLSQAMLEPGTLIVRLLMGYWISLVWGWVQGLQRLFPGLRFSQFDVLLAGIVIAGLLGLAFLITRGSRAGHKNPSDESIVPSWRMLILLAAAGFIAIFAGYFPTVLAFPPGMEYLQSRINLPSSIGAAFFVACSLVAVLKAFALNGAQIKRAFLALMTFLILVGGATQFAAQWDTLVAWNEQKSIWLKMFDLAPGLKPGTHVILLLPRYGNHIHTGARPFLVGSWGYRATLSLLYGNNDLDGYVSFDESDAINCTDQGLLNPWTEMPIPYENALVFSFDYESGHLESVEQVCSETVATGKAWRTLCTDCILPQPVQSPLGRFLVQSGE